MGKQSTSILLTALLSLFASTVECAQTHKQRIIAIDISLDPDEILVEKAKSLNASLLSFYPNRFVLNETRIIHIPLLQRYVYVKNLDKLYANIEKLIKNENISNWRLEISNSHPQPYTGTLGLFICTISIKPNDELLKLQEKLINATSGFGANTSGSSDYFERTLEEPFIDQITIGLVGGFLASNTGENFRPRIVVGIINTPCGKMPIYSKIDPLSFKVKGLSINKLGNFGIATKKLKSWRANPEEWEQSHTAP